MIIVGLTGSIGMGKSFVARQFRRLGAAVFDADKAVHRMLQSKGSAVATVSKLFPEARDDDKIDRKRLAEIVYKDPKALAKLEDILHRKVRLEELKFIKESFKRRRKMVVLDIPLLFETGFNRYCDFVVVALAPEFIQRNRVIKKRGVDEKKFKAILSRQLSAGQKAELADFVINTGLDKGSAVRMVKKIYKDILSARPQQGARARLMRVL